MNVPNRLTILPSEGPKYLEQIIGLGPKCAETLYKNGIRKFSVLAVYSPKELAGLLKYAGIHVTAKTIEGKNWIGQAQELAKLEEMDQRDDLIEQDPEESNLHQLDTFKWEQQAGFTVFFEYTTDEQGNTIWQTRVYHDEEGGLPKSFPGVSPVAWANWMLEQALIPTESIMNMSRQDRTTDVNIIEVATTRYEKLRDAQLKITNVQVVEKKAQSELEETRLAIEVKFELQGDVGKRLATERNPYQIEVQVVNIDSGAVNFVESQRSWLEPMKMKYEVAQELPLPDFGKYKLQSLVLLLPPGEMMACHEGPTINVIL